MILHYIKLLALAAIAFAAATAGPGPLYAQPAIEKPDAERDAKREQEAREALDTLRNLLASRVEQEKAVAALKTELEGAKEEATKKELGDRIKEAQDKLGQTEAQLSALATGVADDAFASRQNAPFDLQAEIVGLAEPFVKLMKQATESAREIEKLRSTMAEAQRQQDLAQKALDRIWQLQRALPSTAGEGGKAERVHLGEQEAAWRKRLQESKDLAETADQQLTLRLDEEAGSTSGVGRVATEFFRTRGFNLLMALCAFFGVFTLFRLIARVAATVKQRQGIKPNFALRLGALVYQIATIVFSLLAMLYVLNMLNDWILLGLTAVFAVAMAWIGLKMLPAIIEQTTLLLNLGAVQEGERVMMAGVPWRVDKLDFYTDLVNPDLEGGSFTIPVRELVGLHSRPAANDEAWFPTRKGDWAELSDGRVGKVVIQTPELVQMVELGGARITYATSDFVAQAPRNLSSGYRVEVEFGIDYRHQAQATREIPAKLKAHVESGLISLLGDEGLKNVQVELASAGDSAINYEIEADIDGILAGRYEDIEREMTRLLVDACNVNGWTIPFPQMVLHRSADRPPQSTNSKPMARA